QWRIRDVGYSRSVGFDVKRVLPIFTKFFFFHIFEIDAGILHRDVLFAAGDLNPEALRSRSSVWGAVRRLRILGWIILCVERQREKEQKSKGGDWEPGGFHSFSSIIVHKLAARRQAVRRRLAVVLMPRSKISRVPAQRQSRSD